MKKILLIDNHDSFVFNVYHLIRGLTSCTIDIYLNSNTPFKSLDKYSHIILSPGPGVPAEAGDLMKLIAICEKSHPIFGICLGHQALAQHFGAELENMQNPLHGHKSFLTIYDHDPVLGKLSREGKIPKRVLAGLYHSWAVRMDTLPHCLVTGAVNENGTIMSLYHKTLPVYGLQFHPESIITSMGAMILEEWFLINYNTSAQDNTTA